MARGAAFGRRAEGYAAPSRTDARTGPVRFQVPFAWTAFFAGAATLSASFILIGLALSWLINLGIGGMFAKLPGGGALAAKAVLLWLSLFLMAGIPLALLGELQRMILNRLHHTGLGAFATCAGLCASSIALLIAAWPHAWMAAPNSVPALMIFAFLVFPGGAAQGAMYRVIAGIRPAR